jgi:hypothetical protein
MLASFIERYVSHSSHSFKSGSIPLSLFKKHLCALKVLKKGLNRGVIQARLAK